MEAYRFYPMLMAALLPLAFASAPNAESALVKGLLETYDRQVRPVNDVSAAVPMELSFVPMNVENMDELNAILTVRSWIRMVWYDDFLKWNSTEHSGIESIRVHPHQIWQPDVRVFNSLEERVDTVLDLVMSNGAVMKIAPATFRVQCSRSDGTYQCPLKMGSWTFSSVQLNQAPLGFWGEDLVDMSTFIESPVWSVDSATGEVVGKVYDCCVETYQSLNVNLEITKKV